MRHLSTGIALLGVLALLSCGGGTSTTLPDNTNTPPPTGGDSNQLLFDVQAPDSTVGGRGTAYVPGQVNIVTGATETQLPAILERYGYELLSLRNGRATVQVPIGAEDAAISTLEKEYNIATAERVNVIHTSSPRYRDLNELTRSASFYPLDPWYADRGVGLDTDGTNFGLFTLFGQGQPMNFQGFPTAWSTARNPAIATQPVTIALIDAGWFDYSTVGRPGLDELILDPVNSGHVDETGTFTPGLAAATWELDDDGDPTTRDFPWRDVGEHMLGVLAADHNSFLPWDLVDFDGSGFIESDEIWNEGIAGINPFATYILIKTGQLNVDTWTFNDNELAASIDHAVASGANIILLGMFGDGAVSGTLSTAIQNARDNDVLVIAPAGDVVNSFDGGSGTFLEAPVDITVSPVSPASDPNVLSVAATGYNRVDPAQLGDVNGVPNGGVGWTPLINPPFHHGITEIAAGYANTGATMAGVGFGMGFTFAPFITSGDGSAGDPVRMFPGENYRLTIDRIGSVWAAAYVAGSASQVFQILSQVNGTPPSDDDVQNELITTAQLQGLPGVATGILDAGAAATSAINGGSLNQTLPALQFTGVVLSQPQDGVTRGTDFSITPTIINGTAPFELTVDWGNGDAPTVVPNWTNSTPVTLAGGYSDLGPHGVSLTVVDDNSLTVGFGFGINVINPLSAGITVNRADGTVVPPTQLRDVTTYRFLSNASNVFTGGGNTTTFEWDFQDDGTFDATGPSPTFQYPPLAGGAQDFTIRLRVTETLRPTTEVTLNVTVSPAG